MKTHQPSRVISSTISVMALLVTLMAWSPGAKAAPYEPDDPVQNPDLDAVCGLDVLMILDESGSIESSDATDNVIDAYTTFVSALNNTGSRVGVVEFSQVARLPIDEYTTVTDDTLANQFLPYIDDDYNPSGNTNWEDALRAARYFMPRPSVETPHLVMFITDGDPTEAIDWNKVTYDAGNPNVAANEYENKIPLAAGDETNGSDANPGKDRAVPNANGIKFEGSHILTVGIGEALQNQSSRDRLIDVSGPDIYDGSGELDISTDDLALVADFDDLADALRDAAFGLCAPSVTVQKIADATPDTGLDDAFPVSGWEVTADVTAPGGVADWVIPPDATGNTAVQETDGAGFATFQWQPGAEGDAQITIIEQDPAADPSTEEYEFDPDFSECAYITADNDTPQPVPDFADETLGFSFTVPFESIVTCQILNRIPPDPVIDIEKFTEGSDADDPGGDDVPFIPDGEPIIWEYQVTNTGNVTLSSVTVTDDPAQSVSCPENSLPPGESMVCTATGTAADTTGLPGGVYANTATASGTFEGTTVTDDDPSHYESAVSNVRIVKQIVTPTTIGESADPDPTNTFDANTRDDIPMVAVGENIEYTFVVSNEGTEDITSYTVTDPVLGPITCSGGADGIVAGGAPEPCDPVLATSVTGFNPNLALVQAEFAAGDPHFDTDPAAYFGAEPDLNIVKYTNLVDANTPAEAPEIPVGERVVWLYEVENTGNVDLDAFSIVDDQQGAPTCLRTTLPIDATRYCFITGTAEPTVGMPDGVYANTGTVTSEAAVHTILGGDPLTVPVGPVTDPSHYRGMLPEIDIEKSTNGEDADLPTGPFLVPGEPVTWEYVVTNTGNETLNGVAVLDPVLRTVVCTFTSFAPGAQETCEATGTAEEGQYVNGGIAAGITLNPQLVGDFDLSHYYGVSGTINLEKFTNGFDADTVEESPYLDVGEEVTWSYIVRNEGNSTMSDIAVVDNQLGDITCPSDTLAVTEEMTCTATGTAEQGLYANTATVTGVDAAGAAHEDTDPSHYRGVVPGINVEKATNGIDADNPPGIQVGMEDDVTWTYVVTTGGHPIGDVTLIDSDPDVDPVFIGGDTDGDGVLELGEEWVYEASSSAVEGEYSNTATAGGYDTIDELDVTNTDPSNYQAVISVTGVDLRMAPLAVGLLLAGLALVVLARLRREG